MQPRDNAQEVACQQVLVDEASIFSTQWMTIPREHAETITPQYLFDKYLKYLRKATLSLVRPTLTADGIDFRLLSTSVSILSFTEPELSEGGHSLTLRIRGGALVQTDQCRRGHLCFIAQPEGEHVKIMLRLSDYCPLLLGGPRPSKLRRWLYRMTQAYIHKKVTISFLARIYTEIAGKDACIRVVRVPPVSGEET